MFGSTASLAVSGSAGLALRSSVMETIGNRIQIMHNKASNAIADRRTFMGASRCAIHSISRVPAIPAQTRLRRSSKVALSITIRQQNQRLQYNECNDLILSGKSLRCSCALQLPELVCRHVTRYYVQSGADLAKFFVPVESLVGFSVLLAQHFNLLHILVVFFRGGKNSSSRALNASSALVALENSSLPRGHSSCGMKVIFTPVGG